MLLPTGRGPPWSAARCSARLLLLWLLSLQHAGASSGASSGGTSAADGDPQGSSTTTTVTTAIRELTATKTTLTTTQTDLATTDTTTTQVALATQTTRTTMTTTETTRTATRTSLTSTSTTMTEAAPKVQVTETETTTTFTGSEFAVSGDFSLTVSSPASFLSACNNNQEVQYAIRLAIADLVYFPFVLPVDVTIYCSAVFRRLSAAATTSARRLAADIKVKYDIEARTAFIDNIILGATHWFSSSGSEGNHLIALSTINEELSEISALAADMHPTALAGGTEPSRQIITTSTTTVTGTTTTATSITTTTTVTSTTGTTTSLTSSTSSTVTTVEAQQAVVIETAAVGSRIAQDLFAGFAAAPAESLNGSSSNESQASTSEVRSAKSSVGLVTAAVLRAEAGATSAQLSAVNSSVRAEVPKEVLEQVAGGSSAVALVLTAFSDESAAAFNATVAEADGGGGNATAKAAELAGAPVGATLYGADGEALAASDLVEPILLTILAESVPGARCAFFNETTGQWSFEGLEEVAHDGPELICSTRHLTIFAAIVTALGDAQAVLICNNAHLLSATGLEAMVETAWLDNASTMFLFAVLLSQAVLTVMACRWDRKARREAKWDDKNFFTSNAVYQKGRSTVARVVGKFEKLQDLDFVSKYTTYRAIAFMQGVSAGDLDKLFRGSLLTLPPRVKARAPRPVQSTASTLGSTQTMESGEPLSASCPLAKEVCDGAPDAFEHFWLMGFYRRTLIIFASFQPWYRLSHFSVSTTSSMRAMLLTSRILGSMMFSALFYLTSNDNVSYDSSEACQVDGLLDALFRNVVVGLASSLGSLVLILFFLLVKAPRDFIYRKAWDEESQGRYLRAWMLRDALLWVVMGAYVAWCSFFLCLFLANVSTKTGLHWLVAAALSVAKELFLMPFLFAVMLSAVATLVHDRMPHVAKRVHKTLRVTSTRSEHREGNSLLDYRFAPIVSQRLGGTGGLQRDHLMPIVPLPLSSPAKLQMQALNPPSGASMGALKAGGTPKSAWA